ncbi:MAG: PEP-CTERM sorting domain-containing protein [Sedimentisphaerales bacterium]|nr:PEP-CTERM sorting domain-containing protein [Sedimentisphaerales bacterium]
MNKYLISLFLMAALTGQAGAELIVAYNETASNASGHYWPYSIGWLWEAATDFSLTRIETRFGSGYEHITVAVYDGLPQFGGILLDSAEYDAVGGLWGGADLDPIAIEEGQDYLISFWNVDGMGMNYTQDSGAEQFSTDNYIYYDEDGEPPASFVNSFSGNNECCTIIRIYGNPIPEPATIALLGLGSLVLLRNRKAERN